MIVVIVTEFPDIISRRTIPSDDIPAVADAQNSVAVVQSTSAAVV